jgi:dihydrofolate reductase
MGRLILQMNLTLDAFTADIDRKLDWMLPEQDERQIAFLDNLTKGISQIILGRKMAEESIPHWEKVASSDSVSKEADFAKFFVRTPKVIFSRTVDSLKGTNTQVNNSELSLAVSQLKEKSKGDIIVYGGAGIVSSLIEKKLIDELNLFFHPIAITQGLRIFNTKTELELLASEAYNNGIVLNRFKIRRP